MRKKDLKLQREFVLLTREILRSPEFTEMKSYISHVNTTLYRHSVKVAYLCFTHHKRWHMKMDLKELIYGALLHDFYLYDLRDGSKTHKLHWFRHSEEALKNASRKYSPLTEIQKDMIKNHMFPLTPHPPKTKAGWLICFYDKLAAVSDCFFENNLPKRQREQRKKK